MKLGTKMKADRMMEQKDLANVVEGKGWGTSKIGNSMDIDHSSIFSLRQRLDVCRIIDLAQDVAHVFSDSKTSETT